MLNFSQQPGPEDLFTAEKLTLVGALIAVIWAIMTQRLVPGAFYEDLKRANERLRRALDEWRATGRVIARTANELAHQQPPTNADVPPDHTAGESESHNASPL